MVNGGAFVIPVLHEITPVNMNVMRIEVRREDAVGADHQRTACASTSSPSSSCASAPSRELVAAAAQTLGRRTLQPDGIRELLEGKFAGAMRTVAAQMTLEEMHEQRGDYARRVRELAVGGARRQRARAGKRGASSISTRPASNISTRPTPSTPRA